jgi:hypothetical protein
MDYEEVLSDEELKRIEEEFSHVKSKSPPHAMASSRKYLPVCDSCLLFPGTPI